MANSKVLILKRKSGNQWYLVSKDNGTIITGPHRWGLPHQALIAALAFASSWGCQVILEEDDR